MLSLDISAAPVQPAVVAGESLVVTTRLRNTGAGPVEIPAPPLFAFAVVGSDGVEIPLSAAGHLSAIGRGEPFPPPPLIARQIAPGAEAEFQDDLGQYALERLLPGEYRALVRLRIGADVLESLFALRVLPPHATHVVSAWDPAQ